MALTYAYKYAILDLNRNGRCRGTMDTSTRELRPDYVPIEDDSIDFPMKYYYPIPEEVNSFADFQGLFYLDAAHTQPFEEGNAVLRHDD